MNVLALDFPPVSHLFEWPDMLFSGTAYAINKTALIYLAAVLITAAIFLLAGRKTGSCAARGRVGRDFYRGVGGHGDHR